MCARWDLYYLKILYMFTALDLFYVICNLRGRDLCDLAILTNTPEAAE